MKHLVTVIFSLVFLVAFSQEKVNFHLSGTIFNANKSEVLVSRFTGNGFEDFAKTTLDKDGKFDLKAEVPAEDYYSVRIGQAIINIIVRKNSDIKIYGDGANLSKFSNIVGSDESANMQKFAAKLEVWNKKKDSAVAIINADQSKTPQVNSDMQPHFLEFQNDFKAFVSENQGSAALIAALGAIDPSQDFASYESIVVQLSKAFPQSPTVKMVMQNYSSMKAQQDAGDSKLKGRDFVGYIEKYENKLKWAMNIPVKPARFWTGLLEVFTEKGQTVLDPFVGGGSTLFSAKKLGLKTMVGCMTESTVGISAIAHLLPQLDYVDMDGSLLLAEDIASGVTIKNGKTYYAEGTGTGVILF